MLAIYAGSAYVIFEASTLIFPRWGLPDWTIDLVLYLLILGAIITFVVSWVYDVTPEGVQKTKPVSEALEGEAPPTPNGWKIASYISLVVILVLIVLNILPRTGEKEILEKSIAVLPFRNDSPDEEKMYFINGTMEAILDNLCKIKDLRVPGRTSVEQYRGVAKPIPEIAEEMNVSYILEGSGQKLGNRILLSIQLLDGKNDQHLWSIQYDREIQKVEDLIDIQSEVAQLVAAEIETIITPVEKQLIEKIPTTNQAAYDFYQRGEEERRKYSFDDSLALERAEDFYHYALEEDSTFALAYTGLAWVYWNMHYGEEFLTENFMDSVLNLTDIALSFDDQLAEAYVIRGEYYRRHNNKEQAIKEYDKALKFNPNDWQAYWNKAILYNFEDLVKCIDNYQKAALLHRGPFLPGLYLDLSNAYAFVGFKEKSRYYIEEKLKLDNDSASYYDFLAHLEELIPNYEKAIEFGKKAYAIDSTDFWINTHLGLYHSCLGQFEESLKYYKTSEKIQRALNRPGLLNIFRIGHAYWENGFIEEAELYFNTGLKSYNEMIELDRNYARDYFTFYNLAAAYAFLGDKEKAFEYLRLFNRVQVKPLFGVSVIKNDRLFDSIRDEPEFQQIVRNVEAQYQAEHERVRKWLEENDR